MAQVTDPNEFIITRKRKKYKFAKFANSPLCHEFEDWSKQTVDVIEVGAGTGLFLVEQAAREPEKTFVAIDVKGDRLQKGAYAAEERGLTNIRFLRARADQLTDCFVAHSLQTIWLTFADPHPKKRSAGRRMTHPTFLMPYRSLLRQDGLFLMKHDSLSFFTWSLEQLVASRWRIRQLSFDLHESEFDAAYKVETTYEKRWRAEGSTINFVAATAS